MRHFSKFLSIVLTSIALVTGAALASEMPVLRVMAVDNAEPMSYRDSKGYLTGFSVEIARALCRELQVQCQFELTTQGALVDALSLGRADFGASGLLDTPERRAKVLLSKAVFRSRSVWFAKAGVQPGESGVRVGVVAGSAQESYVRGQGWPMLGARYHADLPGYLQAGEVRGIIVPMVTALSLQKNESFQKLALVPTVLDTPELGGDAGFAVNPGKPELLDRLNNALDRIKRNGTYDRINSRFIPIRMN